jgi:magnesium transporter
MFAPILRTIELEVETIDELVLILKEAEVTDMLRRIGHARKRVMVIYRLLVTKPDVIRQIAMRLSEGIKPSTEIKRFLSDLQGSSVSCVFQFSVFQHP